MSGRSLQTTQVSSGWQHGQCQICIPLLITDLHTLNGFKPKAIDLSPC